MKASSLRLNGYFFTEDSAICRYGDVLHDKPVTVEIEHLECELQTLEEQSESVPGQATVRLKLSSKDDDSGEIQHYKFGLEVIGNIRFESETTSPKANKDSLEKILVINAANLLYGVMRERLHTKTATMMWGPILLPTLTFDGMHKIKDTLDGKTSLN